LTDEVALVAAVVILVAAEVTFAAAVDTVRAAVAWLTPAPERDVGRAADVSLVEDRLPAERLPELRAVVERRAEERLAVELRLAVERLAVERPAELRLAVERPAALRLAGDRLAAVRLELVPVLGRVVVRVVARLRDPVPAGLRRAVLRAAVCTGIDLPPSDQLRGTYFHTASKLHSVCRRKPLVSA
jgi:hypothetical protein